MKSKRFGFAAMDCIVLFIFVYLELLLAYKCSFPSDGYMKAGVIIVSFGVGCAVLALCGLSNNTRLNNWLRFVISEIVTIVYTVEYFLDESYSAFMSPASIGAGAGGVLTSYKDILMNIILNGVGNIIIFQIPSLLLLALCFHLKNETRSERNAAAVSAFAAVFLISMGAGAMVSTDISKAKYTYEYIFDDSVRTFGLGHSFYLDCLYAGSGVPKAPWAYIPPDEEHEYLENGSNEQNVDWDSLYASTKDPTVQSLINLVKKNTPSNKNDYTGLFKGKNLVLITVESFAKELIDEKYFPLVYRMANEGIVIEDYYHPFWGGSTTSGEAAILTGLIPTEGADTMQNTIGKDNGYTLPSFFNRAGYSSIAYHSGTFDFYNRYITHPGLGFSEFYSDGTGMESYLTGGDWPRSDLEMFKFITDDLVNYDRFYAYIMTFSGHGLYDFTEHEIAIKNRELLKGDELYDIERLGGYVAASMDFELGLEYLVDDLENRGILNDTVFVITNDHFPYALKDGAAWLNTENHLITLYGYEPNTLPKQDHNALIIWTPDLEEREEKIVVSDPCYAPDILPTVLNLFGFDFDSRIYAGQDILSGGNSIVIWNNSSWLTNKGFYDSTTGLFTPTKEDDEVTDAYIEKCKHIVRDKMTLSRNFIASDFYHYFGNSIPEDNN